MFNLNEYVQANNSHILPNNDREMRCKDSNLLSYAIVALFFLIVIYAFYLLNDFIINKSAINDNLSEFKIKNEEVELPQNIVSIDEIIIQNGDTIDRLLRRIGVQNKEIILIKRELSKSTIPLALKAGRRVIMEYIDFSNEEKSIEKVTKTNTKNIKNNTQIHNKEKSDIKLNPTRIVSKITFVNSGIDCISLSKTNKSWSAKHITGNFNKRIHLIKTEIRNNFVSSVRTLNIPDVIVNELVNAYSGSVNFKRKFKKNDAITILIEKYYAEDGTFSHYGNTLYSSLVLSDKEYILYKFTNNLLGKHEYFLENGRSAKRDELITPISKARITSKFGVRKHPIFGYTKMHYGTDFAASIGTPIRSVGSGVVTYIGWKRGYGKCLKIQHTKSFSTFYAHAKSFPNKLIVGNRINKGDIIAYVGTTGSSTAPHLHFEVRVNNITINPESIKYIPEIELEGEMLKKFKHFKKEIMHMVSIEKNNLYNRLHVAKE